MAKIPYLVRRKNIFYFRLANPARWSKDIRNWEWQAEVYLNPDKPNTALSNVAANSVH